jgi:glycosyltransferase involved in cell wall biosynthesis
VRILHVTRSLDPAAGGPPEGIRQFVLAQNRIGQRIEIATLDPPGSPWFSRYEAPVHALGPALLRYGYSPRLRPWLRANARGFDAVIVNGLWQYQGFAAWRELRGGEIPYYVFTHGMLDPWFKRRYPLKHLKKWLYWPWAEYRVLRDARAVLFTCEDERRLASQSFWLYRAHERVVGYGIAPPRGEPEAERQAFLARFPELAGRRLVLYLGRVHPKKGADLLIDAFAAVASQDASLDLVMAGPGDPGWMEELRLRAEGHGLGRRVVWTGMLSGELKWGAFRCAEAFVLPSHQENFGIAVVEAMACGVPVLISKQVNIWREIDAAAAGFAADDDAQGTRSLFERWLGLEPEARTAMGRRAVACFRSHFDISSATKRLLEILREPAPARA